MTEEKKMGIETPAVVIAPSVAVPAPVGEVKAPSDIPAVPGTIADGKVAVESASEKK